MPVVPKNSGAHQGLSGLSRLASAQRQRCCGLAAGDVAGRGGGAILDGGAAALGGGRFGRATVGIVAGAGDVVAGIDRQLRQSGHEGTLAHEILGKRGVARWA
jgi:hypothetical protein